MSELKTHEESVADRPFVADPMPALQRAAQRARLVATQTNTPLVVYRDGQIVQIQPDGREV